MELWIKDYQMTTFVDELYQLSLLVLEIWLVEKDSAAAAARSWRTIFTLKIFALCWKLVCIFDSMFVKYLSHPFEVAIWKIKILLGAVCKSTRTHAFSCARVPHLREFGHLDGS